MVLPEIMHKVKHNWIILLACFALVSCRLSEATISINYEEVFEGVKEIEVSGRFLEVSYEGSERGSQVYLDASLNVPESSGLEIKYRQSGSKLKIEVVGDGANFGWRNMNSTLGFISLTGPEDIKLNFTSSSGKIEVRQVSHPEIDLKASSGSVKAELIEAENIRLTASSGSVRGESLTGNITAQANSGSIRLKDIEGNVKAEVSSGSVRIEDMNGRLDAKASSGNIKVTQVSELGFIKVSSGNINVSESGLGEQSKFEASSGNISIQTTSSLDAFNFDLKGGSGSLRVGDQRKSKRLEINNAATQTVTGSVSSGNMKIVN